MQGFIHSFINKLSLNRGRMAAQLIKLIAKPIKPEAYQVFSIVFVS